MIFQQHHLIARHTALKNVLLGRLGFHTSLRSLLPPSRAERGLALEVLDRVELLDRALSAPTSCPAANNSASESRAR